MKNNNKSIRQKSKLIRGKEKSENVMWNYSEPIPKPFSSEMKYTDTVIGATSAVSNTGSWTKISLPAQGTTSVTRVADRIRSVGIEWKGYFNCTADDTLRIIAIQTKGVFTSPPATTDLLSTTSPFAPYAYNAKEQYVPIFDRLIPLSSQGDSKQTVIETHIKLSIKELRFIPASSNVYNGQIYFLALVTGATVTNGHIFRLWFEDTN